MKRDVVCVNAQVQGSGLNRGMDGLAVHVCKR